jgi:hypothetical protein
MSRSHDLFAAAQRHIPGGVNSPVRAFRGVGGDPVFFESASGPHAIDADGKRYIDYVGSWGPMILGHAHPEVLAAVRERLDKGLSFGAPTELETVMADKVCELVPSMDMVRMVSSGTEATMSALRLARGYTGRDKIVKFEGCYHGHADSLLVKAGSGALTFGEPSSPGVPAALAELTITLRYNDHRSGARDLRRDRLRDRLHHRRAGRRQHELHPAGAGLPGRSARGLRPVRFGADLRRGHDRLPRRARRRSGALRHQARPDRARQGHRRRDAGRRLRRQERNHVASVAARSGLSGRHPVGQPDRHGGRSQDPGADLGPRFLRPACGQGDDPDDRPQGACGRGGHSADHQPGRRHVR